MDHRINYLANVRNENRALLRRQAGEGLADRYINELAYWRSVAPNEINFTRRRNEATGMRLPRLNEEGRPRTRYSPVLNEMIDLNGEEIREYFRLKDKYELIYSEERGELGRADLFNLMLRFLKCRRLNYVLLLQGLERQGIDIDLLDNRQDEEYFLRCNPNERFRTAANRTRDANNEAENNEEGRRVTTRGRRMEEGGGKKKKTTKKKSTKKTTKKTSKKN